MSVENEFCEENFFRLTRRTNSARVLALLLEPRIGEIFGERGPAHVAAINGQGWSNFTLIISFEGHATEYILRLSEKKANSETVPCRSIAHFEKEHAILSRLQGLPFVPALVPGGIGTLKMEIPGSGEKVFAFMVEERMPFVPAKECGRMHDFDFVMQQLGEVCREIHAVSASGFGIDFDPVHGVFSHSTFASFIHEKVEAIHASSISDSMKHWLDARVEELLQLTPEPKLFHRDLLGNPGNYLLDSEHRVRGIIDWEFAGSGPAFHYELASMLYVLARDGHCPDRIEHDLKAVLRGYGMSFVHYRNHYEHDVETIVLLNSLSALNKYAELKSRGAAAQEPWRELFARRAEVAFQQTFARDCRSGRR